MAKMIVMIPGEPTTTRDCPDVLRSFDIFHEWLPVGYVERVIVLHEGKRQNMFVHEEGALVGLPENPAATEIYHAATKARGHSTAGAPKIYGPALLCVGAVLQ